MTSTFNPPALATVPDSATNARAVSSFTALTRRVHELDLMRRRYGYYWTKLVGALVILTAWVLAFIPPPNLQVRSVERLDQSDHRQPARRHQLRLVAKQAQPTPRQSEQGRF